MAIKTKNLITKNEKIGFESSEMSVNTYDQMTQILNKCQWKKTSMIVEKIAATKDLLEIESLKTQNSDLTAKLKAAETIITTHINTPAALVHL